MLAQIPWVRFPPSPPLIRFKQAQQDLKNPPRAGFSLWELVQLGLQITRISKTSGAFFPTDVSKISSSTAKSWSGCAIALRQTWAMVGCMDASCKRGRDWPQAGCRKKPVGLLPRLPSRSPYHKQVRNFYMVSGSKRPAVHKFNAHSWTAWPAIKRCADCSKQAGAVHRMKCGACLTFASVTLRAPACRKNATCACAPS